MWERPGNGGGWGSKGPAAPPRQQFAPGDKVEHPVFGVGTVISSQIVGGDEEIVVAFAGKGVKRLAVSLAKVRKV
jgi:DNA helicase-2/ATP-dependent DNA helicase PcrA